MPGVDCSPRIDLRGMEALAAGSPSGSESSHKTVGRILPAGWEYGGNMLSRSVSRTIFWIGRRIRSLQIEFLGIPNDTLSWKGRKDKQGLRFLDSERDLAFPVRGVATYTFALASLAPSAVSCAHEGRELDLGGRQSTASKNRRTSDGDVQIGYGEFAHSCFADGFLSGAFDRRVPEQGDRQLFCRRSVWPGWQ